MFGNYESLIEYAKDLPNNYDRVAFICSYVIRNVQFNYAEAIKASLFSDIDNLVELSLSEDNTSPYYKELIIAKLYNELQTKCSKIFTNEELKNKAIERVITGVSLANNNSDLLMMLGSASIYINGSVYENGLLQFGVCSDIVDFVSKYFHDLNIEHSRVLGNSNSLHEWLLVNLEGRVYHMDLTDSIYVRDGSYNMDGDITSYYLMSTKNLFELDPNRIIRIIGRISYEEDITKDNYTNYLGGKSHV